MKQLRKQTSNYKENITGDDADEAIIDVYKC